MRIAQSLYTSVFDRRRLALPLVFPCWGGLYYLWAYDAPGPLIAVNAGALALALTWVLLGRLPTARMARLAIGGTAALALFLPLLTGPEVSGVSRWFPAGPMILQSGPLLLPLVTVLAARDRKLGPALLAVAGAGLALQPDAAGLAGVTAAGAILAWLHRSIAFALVAAAALGLAAVTFDAGMLEPQVFTEGVLAQVAERSPFQAAMFALLLFVIPLWHLVLDPQTQRAEGYALAALLIALGVVAMFAPFPFPLIGYGAAPILGFGLALGATARRDQLGAGELFEVTVRTH